MAKRYPMTQLKEREASLDDAWDILNEGAFAVVSTVDEDGSPYGIPLSYVIMDKKMYLHTGMGPGHKFENFMRDNRVSVTVAIDVEPLYVETFFTTRYASVVASGHITKVEDSLTARRALVALCMKYVPSAKAEIGGAIQREWEATGVWVIDFDEIRAKAGRWKKTSETESHV